MEIRIASATLLAGGLLLGGCHAQGSASAGGGPNGLQGSNQSLMPKVDPALCDTSGKRVETYDLNQDGKADVWKLYATVEEDNTKVEVLTCKQVDYDHDGNKDYVAVYNRTGELTAEQFDFTFDGKFDAVEHYDKKGGQVFMVERDLDHNQKIDTWERYDTQGALSSIERDRNGDGKADLWEQYQGGNLIAILYDEDYDGKVDRKENSRPEPMPAGQPSTLPPATGATPGAAGAPAAGEAGKAEPPPAEETPTVEGDVTKAGATGTETKSSTPDKADDSKSKKKKKGSK